MNKILLVIFCLFILSCLNVSAEDLKEGEVGTYQLVIVNDGKKETLFRINTKTGQVWIYSEFVIIDEKQLGLDERVEKSVGQLIQDAKKQGKNVYTLPYWQLTDEKQSAMFTVQ